MCDEFMVFYGLWVLCKWLIKCVRVGSVYVKKMIVFLNFFMKKFWVGWERGNILLVFVGFILWLGGGGWVKDF